MIQIAPFTHIGIENIFRDNEQELKQIYHFYSESEEKPDKDRDVKEISLDKPLKLSQFHSMLRHAGLGESYIQIKYHF